MADEVLRIRSCRLRPVRWREHDRRRGTSRRPSQHFANWRLKPRIILRHINDLRLAWFNDDRLLPGFRGLLWNATHVSGCCVRVDFLRGVHDLFRPVA